MILQSIKHASLLLMAIVGLMGCLYIIPKNLFSILLGRSYYLGGPDGKLYATYLQITPPGATKLKKVWSYAATISSKLEWTTIYDLCLKELTIMRQQSKLNNGLCHGTIEGINI